MQTETSSSWWLEQVNFAFQQSENPPENQLAQFFFFFFLMFEKPKSLSTPSPFTLHHKNTVVYVK